MRSIEVKKERIFTHVKEVVEKKISDLRAIVQSLDDSKNSDTKSSAGDKHETSRAMVQIEKENVLVQLAEMESQNDLLSQLGKSKGLIKDKKVRLGSLVLTDKATFFISIGLGKLQLEGEEYLVVSAASPIAQAMMNMDVGTKFTFMNRDYLILDVF